VVGEGLRTTPGIAAPVFATVSDINISLISQGASRVNLTFVVEEARVREAVLRCTRPLFEREPADLDAAAGHGGSVTDVVSLACELVDVPSVSGERRNSRGSCIVPHGPGLSRGAVRCRAGRPNVLATTDQPPRIVLSTTSDTVPPHIPARIAEGVVYGRGACDAKGIMAAQIAAAEQTRADGVEGIGLLFVVDEENGKAWARGSQRAPVWRGNVAG